MAKKNLYTMSMTALMAAILCVLSPVAIPVGPVPITLCTMLLYLAPYLLGWRRAAASALVYLLLGMAGMPVFQGFTGGLGCVLGPTGGYLLGYIPLTILCGLMAEHVPRRRVLQGMGMVLGTAVLYGMGTTWYCFQSGAGLGAALGLCVLPFLPGDIVKIGVVLWMGPLLRKQLTKAGLLTAV